MQFADFVCDKQVTINTKNTQITFRKGYFLPFCFSFKGCLQSFCKIPKGNATAFNKGIHFQADLI
jgi:hypothetical protein